MYQDPLRSLGRFFRDVLPLIAYRLNRQHNIGWVVGIVVNGLVRHNALSVLANSVPSVHVAVVFGEVAAGNFHADLMTLLEYHTSAAHVDLIAVYGTGNQRLCPIQTLAEAAANAAFGNLVGRAIFSYIHQLGGKIGIHCAGGGPEVYLDGANHSNVLFQHIGAVHQNIVAALHHFLALTQRIARRNHDAGAAGNRICGIVIVFVKGFSVSGNLHLQAAVTVGAVGTLFAGKVIGGKLGLGKRPGLTIVVLDLPHGVIENRGLFHNGGHDPFQPVIKPLDAVICATGSQPKMFSLGDDSRVYSAADVLTGKKDPGQTVVVVGGGLVGCETALWLALNGKTVKIVEALDKLLALNGPLCHANSEMLERLIPFHGIETIVNATVSSYQNGKLILQSRGDTINLSCDSVVLAVGYKENNDLYQSLEFDIPELYCLGDSKKVSNIMYAIWDAFEVANHI